MNVIKLFYDVNEIILPLKKPSLEVLDKFTLIEKEQTEKIFEVQKKAFEKAPQLMEGNNKIEVTIEGLGKTTEATKDLLELKLLNNYYEMEKCKAIIDSKKVKQKEQEYLDKSDFWEVQDVTIIKEAVKFFRQSFEK